MGTGAHPTARQGVAALRLAHLKWAQAHIQPLAGALRPSAWPIFNGQRRASNRMPMLYGPQFGQIEMGRGAQPPACEGPQALVLAYLKWANARIQRQSEGPKALGWAHLQCAEAHIQANPRAPMPSAWPI